MKKSKFVWIIELALFFVGFYIVYQNYMTKPPDAAGEDQDAAVAVVSAAEPMLETAVVCIDVDEENVKPLLAKGTFSKYIDYLYCFTKVSGKRPKVLVHYWVYKGHIVARKKVDVDPSTSACWSRMDMSPDKAGEWRVDIRLEDGELLGTTPFILR